MIKTPIGREFSYQYMTPAISFAAAVHGDPHQEQIGDGSHSFNSLNSPQLGTMEGEHKQAPLCPKSA
jgi:hypothetical protein